MPCGAVGVDAVRHWKRYLILSTALGLRSKMQTRTNDLNRVNGTSHDTELSDDRASSDADMECLSNVDRSDQAAQLLESCGIPGSEGEEDSDDESDDDSYSESEDDPMAAEFEDEEMDVVFEDDELEDDEDDEDDEFEYDPDFEYDENLELEQYLEVRPPRLSYPKLLLIILHAHLAPTSCRRTEAGQLSRLRLPTVAHPRLVVVQLLRRWSSSVKRLRAKSSSR